MNSTDKSEDYGDSEGSATGFATQNTVNVVEPQDTRKLERIKTLRCALLTCIYGLLGLSVFVVLLMISGKYQHSPSLVVVSTVLGGTTTAIIGVIAGTSID